MLPDDLQRLVAQVLASNKYRALSPDLVRTIGAQELAARRSLKAAVKATKGRLHQAAGAFLDRTPPYADWLMRLRAAADDETRLRAVCREIMGWHASTRERLPDLERFYSTIFGLLPPIASLMDLACGLNPLAAPWMPFPPGAQYLACDLYHDLIAFIDAALPLFGLRSTACVCDLTGSLPPWRADAALLLKTLPLLEHLRRGAGREVLQQIDAPYVVVSFPTRSLGGRDVGMAAAYTRFMEDIIDAKGWACKRLDFARELVFVVQKG